MNIRSAFAAACLVSLSSAAIAASASPPDRVYVNAKVWTGDAAHPAAEAFAVQGDRLVAVGSTADVRSIAGPATQVVDLGGRRVVPGFNDAHWHLPARKNARLDDAGSVEVIQQRLVEYAAKQPAGSWVMGRGWVPGDFPGNTADKRYLDAIFPDRPAFIRDRDGHQSLANSKALALAGVTRDTPNPEDGVVVKGPDGEPTGLLKEAASQLVSEHLPPVTAEDTYAILMDEMQTAPRYGLTSLQDASEGGLTDNERAAVMRALANGELKVRYRAAVPCEKDATPAQLAEWRKLGEDVKGTLVSYGIVKCMLDGTIDAKTAYMLEPYVGGGNGEPFMSQADLDATVAKYDAAGFQVEIHAIGDAAVRMCLDAYEYAAKVNGTSGRRHRVEHIEVPSLADIPRFRTLGVVASTQAIFATPDANTLSNYEPLLGPARASHADAFRLFDDAGAVQAFGSDYPVYTMNPIQGIYVAVTRMTVQGTPAGGWYPENRISVEAALRHYTQDAAYASFNENDKGTITTGKYADFVVLSEDLLALRPERIMDAKVLLTVMGGRETWRAPEFGR
ncbi:MAG: amidohydrolase [Steroidobacteraceae bacterium]